DVVVQADEGSSLEVRTETKKVFNATETMPYGDWLKRVRAQTGLPIDRVHAGLVRLDAKKSLPADFFNKATLHEFVAGFTEWMERNYLERFTYSKIEGLVLGTELTDADGVPLECITSLNIGFFRDDMVIVSDKFLYDAFVYVSTKVHDTIRDSKLDEVVVFGKIPRGSLKVPL